MDAICLIRAWDRIALALLLRLQWQRRPPSEGVSAKHCLVNRKRRCLSTVIAPCCRLRIRTWSHTCSDWIPPPTLNTSRTAQNPDTASIWLVTDSRGHHGPTNGAQNNPRRTAGNHPAGHHDDIRWNSRLSHRIHPGGHPGLLSPGTGV